MAHKFHIGERQEATGPSITPLPQLFHTRTLSDYFPLRCSASNYLCLWMSFLYVHELSTVLILKFAEDLVPALAMYFRPYKFKAAASRGSVLFAWVLLIGLCYSFHVLRKREQRSHQPTFVHPTQNNDSFISLQPPGLKLGPVVEYGHIVEVEGSTDPEASVMINGQPAAIVFPGNSFRHFIGPLPSGTTIITITSQNARGGVSTRQVAIYLQ